MYERSAIQFPKTTTPACTSAPARLLQRACACGQHTGNGDECEACRKKRLQRAAISSSPVGDVPPIVYEVLRSPSQSLDSSTRAFMEPRIGHDFSRIPTYTPAVGVIQTKLAINQPGDEYEQEADRIAEQVLAASAHPAVSGAAPRIQRFTRQATGQANTAPASVDRVLASPGRPLNPALQQEMGQRFGHDFSQVRVHSGAAAEQSAREVNAYAYTVGPNIVFGAGQLAPGTHQGRRLIAHELTHVVQQDGGQAESLRSSNPSTATLRIQTRTASPSVLFRQGMACDQMLTKAINDALVTSSKWRDRAVEWLKVCQTSADNIRSQHDKLPQIPTIVEGFVTKLALLNRHFNISQFLAENNRPFPADATSVRPEHVGDYKEAVERILNRYKKLTFNRNFVCEATCSDQNKEEGGHSIPGSGEFTICQDVFDCQDLNAKTCMVLHEAVHANFGESNFDVYITNNSYPGKYNDMIKNPDSLANFAAVVNTRQQCAYTICFKENLPATTQP